MHVAKITGLFVALTSLTWTLAAADQPPGDKPAVTSIFSFKGAEIRDGDSELTRLLKQRYNAAGEELLAHSALYIGGRVTLEAIVGNIDRFTKAGVELYDSPMERVEHLERVLTAAKNVQEVVREKFRHEVEPVQAMKRADYLRYDVEIQLHRAREAAKAK
jgi:hypothetical protein